MLILSSQPPVSVIFPSFFFFIISFVIFTRNTGSAAFVLCPRPNGNVPSLAFSVVASGSCHSLDHHGTRRHGHCCSRLGRTGVVGSRVGGGNTSLLKKTIRNRSRRPLQMVISYEDLAERLPSEKVIMAVDNTPTGKVIAADVASSAGISLSEARKQLTALATLSKGDIAVTKDGELVYTFPNNLNSVLGTNSLKYRLRSLWQDKIFPPLFYLVRVSFGIMLLVSIALIFSTIAFISAGSSSRDDDDRGGRRDVRGGGGFGGFNMMFGPSPFDFFFYRPYGYYYYTPGGGMSVANRRPPQPEEMGFLESVFSYIFGDGNPNAGLEERRVRLAASLIRDNDGAVTAEQLAPFCDDLPSRPELDAFDDDDDDEEKIGDGSSIITTTTVVKTVDESYVLPIVTKLGGEPRVTDGGDIIYVFPELQQSASSSSSSSSSSTTMAKRNAMILERVGISPNASSREIKRELQQFGVDTRGALERSDLVKLVERFMYQYVVTNEDVNNEDEREFKQGFLEEDEYKFSLAGDFNKFLAGGLGVVNLGGALYLGNILSSVPALVARGVQLPGYVGFVQAFYPLLLGYAVLYNVIPLARSFWIKGENAKINERNDKRKTWRNMLQASSSSTFGRMAKKLKEATGYRLKMKRLGGQQGKKDIVFDTTQSSMEREIQRESDELKQFDQMLQQQKNLDKEKSFE